jgi:hypothetical protein
VSPLYTKPFLSEKCRSRRGVEWGGGDHPARGIIELSTSLIGMVFLSEAKELRMLRSAQHDEDRKRVGYDKNRKMESFNTLRDLRLQQK